MILLPVSEAYAYDYLAILEVKRESGLPVQNEIRKVQHFLREQCDNFAKVKASPEYAELIKVNKDTFDAIELAHKDMITSSEVQRRNMARFHAKRALQQAFWPNEELSEQKSAQ